jgi:DNA-binding CsgD family transcriptional regulator
VAQELAQAHGDLQLELNVVNGRAAAALHRGETARATSLWEEALSRANASGRTLRRTGLLHNLALAYLLGGDLPKARATHAEALELARSLGNSDMVSYAMLLLTELQIAEGNPAEAHATLEAVASTALNSVDESLAADVAAIAGSLANTVGKYEIGAKLLGLSKHRRAAMGYADPLVSDAVEQAQRAKMHAALGGDAVQKAMAEGADLSNDDVLAMIRDLTPASYSAKAASDHGLTERELDVLRQLGSGATNQEIADRLFISARTVQTHVANILAKLNVPSRAAAASLAEREGLI